MPTEVREVRPGDRSHEVKTANGQVLVAPAHWVLVPPGDAALTRRVKAGGPHWLVKEKKGRRTFSRGVWAPAERVSAIEVALEGERRDPAYQRKLAAARKKRGEAHAEYAVDFRAAVFAFLDFAPRHEALANAMSQAIADHAVPVGSGTVARTKRIPIERRAEAATIAWLRHHTTGYDDMPIPRVKGMRREVRRLLAQRSRQLLGRYRRGEPAVAKCPLHAALARV